MLPRRFTRQMLTEINFFYNIIQERLIHNKRAACDSRAIFRDSYNIFKNLKMYKYKEKFQIFAKVFLNFALSFVTLFNTAHVTIFVYFYKKKF